MLLRAKVFFVKLFTSILKCYFRVVACLTISVASAERLFSTLRNQYLNSLVFDFNCITFVARSSAYVQINFGLHACLFILQIENLVAVKNGTKPPMRISFIKYSWRIKNLHSRRIIQRIVKTKKSHTVLVENNSCLIHLLLGITNCYCFFFNTTAHGHA